MVRNDRCFVWAGINLIKKEWKKDYITAKVKTTKRTIVSLLKTFKGLRSLLTLRMHSSLFDQNNWNVAIIIQVWYVIKISLPLLETCRWLKFIFVVFFFLRYMWFFTFAYVRKPMFLFTPSWITDGRILISRTCKKKYNWFEKSGSLRNRQANESDQQRGIDSGSGGWKNPRFLEVGAPNLSYVIFFLSSNDWFEVCLAVITMLFVITLLSQCGHTVIIESITPEIRLAVITIFLWSRYFHTVITPWSRVKSIYPWSRRNHTLWSHAWSRHDHAYIFTGVAIDKRKFLLNRLFVEKTIPQDED